MRDELIAYLLDDLSSEERQRIEDRLVNDPIWKNELERLRECVKDYAADPNLCRPPSDLVNRTCRFVHNNAQVEPATLTEAQDAPVGNKRWSLLDLAVTATVLIAVGSLLFPALRSSRESARQVDCQNKLYHLGIALVEYADRFGDGTPHVNADENAGIFVVKLADSGVIERLQLSELLVCPSSSLAKKIFAGQTRIQIPTQAKLKLMSEEMLARIRQHMAGSYAYRLGYRDQAGNYHQVRFMRLNTSPMLADTPSFSIAGFQSANHGGCGQNVLFQDLSSRHVKLCLTQDDVDHLYLNEDHKHAAGRHKHDVVLGRSEVGPSGSLVQAAHK
jgi:hypothetical protein